MARCGARRSAAQQQQPDAAHALFGRAVRKLEAETGQATGWHGVGSLRLASSPARWQEFKRSATMAKGFGFHVDLISAREARERFPLLEPAVSSAPHGSQATATSIRPA